MNIVTAPSRARSSTASSLRLDGARMNIVTGYGLKYRDGQIWGKLTLTYGDGRAISREERAELERGGFRENEIQKLYKNYVEIAGIVYPAIELPDDHLSKLKIHRELSLYHPHNAKPPLTPKRLARMMLRVPLLAIGVAADVILTPVYLAGLGIVTIIMARYSPDKR